MATKSKSKSPVRERTAGAKVLKELVKKKVGPYSTITREVVASVNGGFSVYTIEIAGSCKSFKVESESESEAMNFMIAGLSALKDNKKGEEE